ncbi:MAG: porin family protein [Ginsengibacter sp.]
MKKIFLVVAVLTISTTIGYTQKINGFGIKAGITSANLKFSGGGTSITADSKIGFYGGLLAQIGVSGKFAVQPEIIYSLLGTKFSQGSGEDKLNLSYVCLPVLAKYIHEGFSIIIGPQVGFLVSAKEKTSGTNDDIKPSFKSTDIAGIIGAGYTFTNGVGFDGRYQLGLSNIGSNNEPFTGGGKIKNNAFLFGLHYVLGK